MRTLALATCLAAAASIGRGIAQAPPPSADPIASELSRWAAAIADTSRTDPLWTDAKTSGQAALKQAQDELAGGRRLIALERLSAVNQTLGGSLYASERPELERKDLAAVIRGLLEAAWTLDARLVRIQLSETARNTFAWEAQ